MWSGRRPQMFTIAAALALQSSICAAQQSNIGKAATVRKQVEGIIEGQTRNLSSGNAVHSNELIRSGDAAVAEVRFYRPNQAQRRP